jgi:DNA repair exonuclease SbcCD ATPase subunit
MTTTRDAYVQKIKAKLDEWNAEIDRLEAQARQKEADAQTRLQEQIDQVKAKRKTAEEKLDDVRQAGGDAWEDLKSGLELATEAVGDALRSARSRFQ